MLTEIKSKSNKRYKLLKKLLSDDSDEETLHYAIELAIKNNKHKSLKLLLKAHTFNPLYSDTIMPSFLLNNNNKNFLHMAAEHSDSKIIAILIKASDKIYTNVEYTISEFVAINSHSY